MLHGVWQRFSSDVQLPRAPAKEFLWLSYTSFAELDGLRKEMDAWEGAHTSLPATIHGTEERKARVPRLPLSLGQKMTTSVTAAAFYLSLLVRTRVIPVLVRVGLLAGGTEGEVGAVTLASAQHF